mmetsp:Transcript_54608/g.111460  ORF Transcript_54608/g.111460 Transcript_54608/m.111460 type:complete len:236 (-) Transcript_54608:17-724(-)
MSNVRHVSSPIIQAIENVSGEEHCHAPLITLLLQYIQQSLPRQNVQVCRHLIQQQDLGGLAQGDKKLDSAFPPIGELVDFPIQVDPKPVDDHVTALWHQAFHKIEQALHFHVTLRLPALANNGAFSKPPNSHPRHDLCCPTRSDSGRLKCILAHDLHYTLVLVHPSNCAQQASLPCPVRTDNDSAAALGQRHVDVRQSRSVFRPVVVHALHHDRILFIDLHCAETCWMLGADCGS